MDQKIKDILDEVGKVIRGKDEQIQMVLTAILAKGHILIEDIPGVGKTTMAVCFSRAMELTERRLQFTPDVLPSDVVGFNMLDADGEMQYKPGAILCNILLADEINRTSHKDPVCSFGGHGRGTGYGRWCHKTAAKSICRCSDSEPGRFCWYADASGVSA